MCENIWQWSGLNTFVMESRGGCSVGGCLVVPLTVSGGSGGSGGSVCSV